jgi:lysophospholipase L1-like esterase
MLRGFRSGGGALNASIEAAGLGDSYISNAGTTGTTSRLDFRGWMHWANQLIGAPLRFRPAVLSGVSGETAAQILSRVSTITGATPRPRLCFISAGSNDVNTGVATATTVTNIQSIIAALNGVGIIAVMGPVFARSTSTAGQITATRDLNLSLRGLARANSMIWCDWSNLIGADGQTITNTLSDGIHPGTTGARGMAWATASALAPIITGRFPLAATGDAGLMTNALLSGTDGTMNQGFTGQNATGWSFFRSEVESGGTKTCAKVTRADGNGDWLQIAFSGVTGTGAGYSAGPQSPALSYATAGLVENDWVEAGCEVEIDPGATNFEGVRMAVLDNNGASTLQYNWSSFVSGGAAHNPVWQEVTRLTIRTPPFQIRADAGTDSITFRVLLAGDSTAGGGITATARIGRATLRRLS